MSAGVFAAMGTTVEVWPEESTDRVSRWFEEVEACCSRFRRDSELSMLNDAGPGLHPVSGLMHGVLVAADRARSITDGVVDVGVGSAVSAWGYDRTFEDVQDLESEPGPVPRGDWSVEGGAVRLSGRVHLDFGGIAKGWSCDRAVEDGRAAVVSAGGDMRSGDPQTIANLIDPWGATMARVAVGDGALATSSVTRRRWMAGGHDVSHIIDPRSMRPVETPVLSASVVAGTAVDAEAAAKTVLILGAEGLSWADRQAWVRSAIVVWDDGAVYATTGTEWAA